MMLCGACLLFLAGPNVQKTGLLKHRARAKRIINVCKDDLHVA